MKLVNCIISFLSKARYLPCLTFVIYREKKATQIVITDLLKIQSLTGDNDFCKNRFTPQQEVSFISRWQLPNHPIRRLWLPFRLSFSIPARNRRMCAYICTPESAKEMSERSQVFPLRFSALHHPSELIGGMRKGGCACVRACVRARDGKEERRLFQLSFRDISKDEIDVDRSRECTGGDGSFPLSSAVCFF